MWKQLFEVKLTYSTGLKHPIQHLRNLTVPSFNGYCFVIATHVHFNYHKPTQKASITINSFNYSHNFSNLGYYIFNPVQWMLSSAVLRATVMGWGKPWLQICKSVGKLWALQQIHCTQLPEQALNCYVWNEMKHTLDWSPSTGGAVFLCPETLTHMLHIRTLLLCC